MVWGVWGKQKTSLFCSSLVPIFGSVTSLWTTKSVCLSVCLSVCRSFCLSVCRSFGLSACLSVGLSVCRSINKKQKNKKKSPFPTLPYPLLPLIKSCSSPSPTQMRKKACQLRFPNPLPKKNVAKKILEYSIFIEYIPTNTYQIITIREYSIKMLNEDGIVPEATNSFSRTAGGGGLKALSVDY